MCVVTLFQNLFSDCVKDTFFKAAIKQSAKLLTTPNVQVVAASFILIEVTLHSNNQYVS